MNLRVFYLTRRGLSDGYAFIPHASPRPFHQNSPFFGKIFPKTNVHHVILHIFVIQI